MAANQSHTVAPQSRVMETLARSMPWVISLLFHLGLFLIMMFVVYIITETETPVEIRTRPVFLPEENHFIIPTVSPSENLTSLSSFSPRPSNARTLGERTTNHNVISRNSSTTPDPAHLIRTPSNQGPSQTTASRGGEFFSLRAGTAGANSVDNVVYVIDCSGSMIDTFGHVRDEVLTSITRLGEKQHYHVILFSEGRPLENPPKRLVRATRKNRIITAHFLQSVPPQNRTEVIPALRRAFAVLRNAKQHTTIFLLTDGVFSDNQAVLDELRTLNAAGRASISTILYGARPAEAETLMKAVAKEHRGQYRFVPYD